MCFNFQLNKFPTGFYKRSRAVQGQRLNIRYCTPLAFEDETRADRSGAFDYDLAVSDNPVA